MEGFDAENLQVISSVATINNFYKLDPLIFTVPHLYYRINTINSSGLLIGQGDIVPTSPVMIGDATLPMLDLCAIKCNGKTNAWQLTAKQKQLPFNQLGGVQLEFTGTFQYYNAATGDYTPFWQPINQTVWNAMGAIAHPYTVPLAGFNDAGQIVYAYDKKPVIGNMTSVPFRDKNNNVVTNGYLVEKQLDEYRPYGGGITVETASATTNICLAGQTNMFAWTNFFNLHRNQNIQLGGAAPVPFNIVPNSIACSPAFGQGQAGGNGVNWNQWVIKLYERVAKIEKELNQRLSNFPTGNGTNSWNEILDEFKTISTISSSDGEEITGIHFASALNENNFLSFVFHTVRNEWVLDRSGGNLDKGVYDVSLYTSNGNVISSIISLSNDLVSPKIKDFVLLALAPNPIENDMLRMNINSKRETPATVLVYNLNNQILSNQSISLINGDTGFQVDLVGMSHPYNQIRIAVIFEDGSLLQVTGAIN